MSSSMMSNTEVTRGPVLDSAVEARSVPQLSHPHIQRRKETGPAPLSFAQERLWFLDQIEPDTPIANLSRGLKLIGRLDQQALRQSLQNINHRHDALRTTFATSQLYAGVDSRPAQLIANDAAVELHVTDLSSGSSDERLRRARELAQAEAQQAFDLSIGPLLRARLLVLDRDEHVLLLTVHRIVSDDCSLTLLLQELVATYATYATYAAGVSAVTSELPALPIQLADYASWQQATLTADVLESHAAYWQRRLRGAPAMLEIPADRPRPPVQNWHGATVSVVLEEELSDALRALARAESTSLFPALMTAFQILLSRYSRQTDIVTGSQFANREAPETMNLVGPLANAFFLRTDLSGDPTFRELLAGVRKNLHEAEAHRLMPFEKLVEEMPLERSMSYAPVFQVAMNVREKITFAAASRDLLIEEFSFETGISRLDLTLDVRDVDEIELRFDYDSDLFDRETIASLAGCFEVLLRGIVRNPRERCSELPLLSNDALKRIGHEGNSQPALQQNDSCIDELFAAAAEKIPRAMAVVCGEDRLSYSELNCRANQLAHYLRRLGVKAESRVGVYLERSVNNIVALLGILKAGGAYVPIDPTYPPERVSFMLADSGVPVLITQKSLTTKLKTQHAEVIQIDEDWTRIASESEQNPSTLVSLENLAYVIYTSGSTGRPKGVSVTHQTVAHLFAATCEQVGFHEGDVWTTVHSSAFDFSVWEIWGALLQGGRLVIVPLETTQSPGGLYELLLNEGVTILNQTPSALRQLLDSEPDLKALRLRTIVCGGDALDRELAERVSTIGIPVWNFYGPTESTVWATCTRIEVAQTAVSDFSAEIQLVQESQTEVCATSIGRPIRDLEILILDENLHALPVGVPGEICIGGAGLARGYLQRPELTAERFVPHPFTEKFGERLYRTGDLGRYWRSGKLEFLGRLDNQVKLRGFRIELGEIETVLGQLPEVEQAVVIIREDQPGDKRLVAYLVPAGDDAGSNDDYTTQLILNARRLLAEKLPEYMMPAAFVLLDALPLTPNRKIDRRALPKTEAGRRGLESNYVAPRDNFERQLANIWVKILGHETVGVKDNFFELGGHSLLAVRLFAQIENRFGKRLPLAALFQAPTIEQLANVLRENAAAAAWSSLVAIQPQGSKPPLFCIHAAGANVLIYRPLSRHLGNDQPVFALQAQGLDGRQSPFLHVEDMAAHYIRELRAFQSHGPYHLLGASFGGLVIFEMAHQLLAQGQQVGLLAMLNTNCPVYPAGKKIRFHLAHLREHGPRFYAGAVWQTLKRKMGQPTVSVDVSDNADPELARLVADRRNGDEALVRTVLAILDAEKDYVPRGKIYPGKINLFWAQDADAASEDNRLGWARLARGGLKIHRVPGTHISIREEPHVAVLAKKIRECLEAESL